MVRDPKALVLLEAFLLRQRRALERIRDQWHAAVDDFVGEAHARLDSEIELLQRDLNASARDGD